MTLKERIEAFLTYKIPKDYFPVACLIALVITLLITLAINLFIEFLRGGL